MFEIKRRCLVSESLIKQLQEEKHTLSLETQQQMNIEKRTIKVLHD